MLDLDPFSATLLEGLQKQPDQTGGQVMETTQVSPEAHAELLQIMAENDSQIVPERLFWAVVKRHPLPEAQSL